MSLRDSSRTMPLRRKRARTWAKAQRAVPSAMQTVPQAASGWGLQRPRNKDFFLSALSLAAPGSLVHSFPFLLHRPSCPCSPFPNCCPDSGLSPWTAREFRSRDETLPVPCVCWELRDAATVPGSSGVMGKWPTAHTGSVLPSSASSEGPESSVRLEEWSVGSH